MIVGKVKLTEGAFSDHHPDVDPPRNVWDPAVWPGVSSSGSGVAVGAGLAYGAIGTDTGGSIRFPSASNGIVGIKPTYGRVSRHGAFPLAESLDHIGPMTRSVEDAARMLGVLAGHDKRDPTSIDSAPPNYGASIGEIRFAACASASTAHTQRTAWRPTSSRSRSRRSRRWSTSARKWSRWNYRRTARWCRAGA